MTIGFNQLPSTIRVPLFYAEFDNSNAVSGLAEQPFRVLITGQMLSSGSSAQLVPHLVTSKEQGAALFGAGSVISNMINSFFKGNNNTEVWAVGLTELSGGVKAAGKLSFSGTPTAAGIVSLMVGGINVQVGVATTDTPTSIATAAAAAINAIPDMVVTAAVDGTNAYEVNLVAKNKGLHGNEISVRHSYFSGEMLPTGLTLAITPMASGAGNPDVSQIFAVIGETQYLLFVSPFLDTANLVAMETELDSRFGPIRQNDGYAIYGKRSTVSGLVTIGDGRNSKYTNIMMGIGPSNPWEVAAAYAAQVATSVQADDPVRPFHTLPLVGIWAPSKTEHFLLSERDILLHHGIATFDVDSGGVVRVEGPVTTYKLNTYGSPDISYLYLNQPLTLSYLRFSSKARITQKFGRSKLADDGTRFSPGQVVATPNVVKAELINLFTEWEEKAIVEGFEQFKTDLIVERNPNNPNRLDILLPPNLVNQLVIAGMKIRFLL